MLNGGLILKNHYLLLPLIGCIWILSLCSVHFFTMQSNHMQLNRFTVEQIEELKIINTQILNDTQTATQDYHYLLKEGIQLAKTLDFRFENPLFAPIYSNLQQMNELLLNPSSNYLKVQHETFLKSYLEDIQSILQTIHLSADPLENEISIKRLVQLLEVTTSYYKQYKN